MKTVNTFLAGLAALAISSPASADVAIRITGSTAFRSNTHTALTTGTPTGLGFTQTAFTGTSGSGAKYSIYEKGTSPNKIIIKANWTGSVGGILTVAQQRTDVKWLPDIGTGTPVVAAGGSNSENSAATDGVPPDIAFSDVFQSTTVFKTPQLADAICGINQFRLVTNFGPGGVNPITSVNSQQIRALLTSATGLPLSVFTGNAADTARVYGIGRDPDSGTRVTQLAETGLNPNGTVVHWSPTSGNGTVSGISGTAINALEPWPATTLFDINYGQGNSGYASGGDLARVMRYDTSAVSVSGGAAAPCYFIAAVSKSDAATVLAAHNPPTTVGGGPGKIVKFNNGDDPAFNSVQIAEATKNGTIPFWSYLHCMHNGLTGEKLTFYTDLTLLLKNSVSSDIKLDDMKVERVIDGATITVK